MKFKEFCPFLAAIGVFLSPLLYAGEAADSSSPKEDYEIEAQHLETTLYEHLAKIADSLNLPAQNSLREVQNKSFAPGERLVFRIKFGFFSAGTAILEVAPPVLACGTQCYRLVSKAISNRFVSTFYPVRDIFLSLVDVKGLYPVQFEKHLREGGYRNDYWILFDQKNHRAYWQDTLFTIADYAQDILSPLYYVRTLPLGEPGKEIYVDCHTDRKNYPLKVIFHNKETIEVEAGKFNCLVVEPVYRTEGLFKKKGTLLVWLTDDTRHMPVRMKSKIYAIGSITANLISYKNGQ